MSQVTKSHPFDVQESSLWLTLKELEIKSKHMTDTEKKFIKNVINYANPFNPEEELSNDQIKWIKNIHKKYVARKANL